MVHRAVGETGDGRVGDVVLAAAFDPGFIEQLDAGEVDFARAFDGERGDVVARVQAEAQGGEAGVGEVEEEAATGGDDDFADDVGQIGGAEGEVAVVGNILQDDALGAEPGDDCANVAEEAVGDAGDLVGVGAVGMEIGVIGCHRFEVEVNVGGAGAREEALELVPIGGLAGFGVDGVASAGADPQREVDVERVAGADHVEQVGPGGALVAVEGDLPGGEEIGGGAGVVDGEVHGVIAFSVNVVSSRAESDSAGDLKYNSWDSAEQI